MLLCHLSEAVAAPLSRGDSPKHGDSERIREQAPRRGYSAIQYFNRLQWRLATWIWIRPKILLVPYGWVMKTPAISLVLLAAASSLLSGCASPKESVTQSTVDQTLKRVHTQEALKKTGEAQTGPALEKVDPAVQTSHP